MGYLFSAILALFFINFIGIPVGTIATLIYISLFTFMSGTILEN